MFAGFGFAEPWFADGPVVGATPPPPLGPGDLVTTEPVYFARTVTARGVFARAVTAEPVYFARTVTTQKVER